jgi:hypothetical protein
MAITVQDVINKVRFLLAEPDPNNSFFSDADIIKSINTQIEILFRDLEINNARITLELQAGVMEYQLPDDVEEVYLVWFEKDRLRYQCKYVEFDDFLDEYDFDTTGDILSVYYLRSAIVDDKEVMFIGFYPKPSTNMTVYLDVLKLPKELTQSTDIVPIKDRYFNLLVYLVITEMLERDKRYDEANYYYTKYKDRVLFEIAKQKNKIPQYVD